MATAQEERVLLPQIDAEELNTSKWMGTISSIPSWKHCSIFFWGLLVRWLLGNLQKSPQVDEGGNHWEACIRWMEEILHHLGWLKPYTYRDKPSINWCRISQPSTEIIPLGAQLSSIDSLNLPYVYIYIGHICIHIYIYIHLYMTYIYIHRWCTR